MSEQQDTPNLLPWDFQHVFQRTEYLIAIFFSDSSHHGLTEKGGALAFSFGVIYRKRTQKKKLIDS